MLDMTEKKLKEYNFKKIEKSCPSKKGSIYGELFMPEGLDGEKHPLIIFCHELGVTLDNGVDYAEYFASLGIPVYAFDFSNGAFKSRSNGTDMSKLSAVTERDDLYAVLDEIKNWDFVDQNNIVLFGASAGALVCTMVAVEHPEVAKGLMCIYPAYIIRDDVKEQFKSFDDIPETFSYRGWFTAGRCFAADLWDYDIYKKMDKYKKPVILIHGEKDYIVDKVYSEKAEKAFPDAKLHIIERAGHGFFRRSFFESIEHMTGYLQDIGILEK